MVKKYTTLAVSRKADKRLRALLRSPKSKRALYACLELDGVSKKFVDGWLVAALQQGDVVKHGAGLGMTYQLVTGVSEAPEFLSQYPEWLAPKKVPAFSSEDRHVHLKVNAKAPTTQEDES